MESEEMTEEEHRQYHLEVSLTGCGVEGCDWVKGFFLHEETMKAEETDSPGALTTRTLGSSVRRD